MQKETNIFTLIFEYDEGTYISQIEDKESTIPSNTLLLKWLNEIDSDNLINNQDAILLKEDLTSTDIEPIPLNNLLNIWCVSFNLTCGLALINIVLTRDV